MAQYVVMSGETYYVEADSEEQALEMWASWYDEGFGPDWEELDELISEGEVCTIVIGKEDDDEGTCDTCSGSYELASLDGRCGDCGNCSDCCTHV